VNHCVSHARAYFMHRLFLLFGCILRVIFVNRNRSIFRRQHSGPPQCRHEVLKIFKEDIEMSYLGTQ